MGLIDSLVKNANPVSTALSVGTSLAGIIGGGIANMKSNKELKKLIGEDVTRTESPEVRDRLNRARLLLNAPMPSSAARRRNAESSYAATLDAIRQGATDSSKFLATAGAASGNLDRNLSDVENMNDQYSLQREANYSNAVDQQAQQDEAQYQDKIRRFGNKVQMQGAIAKNRANFWQSLTNLGGLGATFGAAGGFGNGGQEQGGQYSINPTPMGLNGISRQRVSLNG